VAFEAALLVVLSAFCHAGWNYIGKKTVPFLSFFTLVSVFAALLLIPFVVMFWAVTNVILKDYAVFVLMTGFFQAWYFVGLSGGYRGYELSVIYPLARALPVAMVPIAVSLLQGDNYSMLQYVGVAGIILGCLMVPFRNRQVFWSSLKSKGVLFAFIAAVATTGYSYIDQEVLTGLAAHLTHFESWQRSLVYMFWLSVSASFWTFLFSCCTSSRAEQWRSTLFAQKSSAFSTACVMTLTYSLVLIAMNYVEHVGEVVALRQISIPIGVAMGVIWLKESFNPVKLLGLILLMAGIWLVLS
jgi:drug/metabolite transporter (DMT)-like permease